MNRALLFLVPLVLFGCAASEKVPVSRARLEADAHNRRGIRAAATGETELALGEFAAAQRSSASVEDSEGAALALLNGARVARFANRTTHSRTLLSQALPLVSERSELYPELAFEQAKLALVGGDFAPARQWAQRSVDAEKGGRLKARLNLLGRIEAAAGRYPEAESTALKGRAVQGEPEETANTDRLLAEIYLATARLPQARQAYLAALSADTEAGRSARIAADLTGLAQVAAKEGALPEAITYYRRAAAVHLARGERNLAAQRMKAAGRLLEASGKKDEGVQAYLLGESYLKEAPAGNVMQKGGD
ncbi:tetratricopeptide repeat protein [Geomesophilobacter sediminis]|uniref:Tetratricopeptide repeat protein n=1 Tax=Geomesophilobacter sediminis TaxID=2798584 RepID=A0A8J7M162_9BACT|nr:hypothetical protein [Geomesophilobacter sediminis]MBJ6726737.1 hypothetical protein [Geomesophilobacter sediminis]